MAFGKKYYSSYKSNNDIDYYLEIWLKDYDSTASEITIGAGGPIITYETEEDDRFSPILSSNCKLPLMVTDTLLQTFVSQLRTTYQEKEVYLHLYKATSSTYTTTKPIWSGFLTMDLGSGEDVSFPYEQELIFVDGLSLLKEIDFVDFSDPDFETRKPGNYAPENMYWGPARYTYWIKEILLKSGAAISGVNGQGVTQDYGFTTAVNWYNGTMTSTSQSSDPLYLTECKASMFHTKDENETFIPDNCYDVLKELLRHWGARITYWKHEFWIVQIPEYIVDESGFIDNPDNINSRQYNKSGTYLGSQDHLGDTYSSRYEQTIQSNQISKLVGTKYNYLPAIHRVNAKFLSLNGENHFGGFPFGANPYGIDFFQSRINNPSSADFLWVSIPLNWKWDMSGTALPNGHTNGWWARIRFNLYCTQNNGGTITTYYLQYKSSDDSYYWVDSSNWTPLGNESPSYIISSRNLVETDYIGFQEQIEFVDSSGSNISLTGDWDFYMSIENYGTSANNPGSFYCRFSGYSTGYVKRNPTGTAPSLPAPGGGGASTGSGTVSWSNSLQDNSISFNSPTASSTNYPSGYNTGASQVDKAFTWKSPLKGFLQVLSNTVNATYGITNDTIVSNSSNTEVYGFGDLLWGDSIVQTARGNLNVWNGSAFTKTNVNGKWGRGSLTGEKTFTQMLIDEFLTGQVKVVISPSMRLVVGEQNKNQTATASGGGTATRPRYVNPIGRLRETRSNETDPEYFFRRGSFHTLYDEWDYEGYQILRDTITVTTNTNDIGSLGGSQDDNPIDAAKVKSNVETALMMNSPVAYVRTTVPATGSNVIVNGNFNVATGWTLGTGWTIDTTTKKAKFAATGSTSDLVQSVLTAELTYQINFTVEVTAGSLIVKAGSTGTSQTITTSGDYSIYLDCEGSTDIKFTAGTTFTGTITYITAKDQKSISSIPINVIGSTVFKTNDTLDLVNSRDGEIMTLNVSSNQGASDDTISVTSTPLFEDVAANSVLLINQDDLSAQYQNKTKGTVGGFDITATSIDSGSVAISSYIDDDTFASASATSLATSESIKAYVDGQAGHSETLQGVTDNGNTTTNSIMIGSSSSPSRKLEATSTSSYVAVLNSSQNNSFLSFNDANTSGDTYVAIGSENGDLISRAGNTERMRLTTDGRLGLGTSSPSHKLTISSSNNTTAVGIDIGSSANFDFAANSSSGYSTLFYMDDVGLDIGHNSTARAINFKTGSTDRLTITGGGNVGINQVNPTEKLHVVGDALITGDSHADAFKPAVSGNPIKFKNFGSTEVARITDGGNFAIGTTNPSYGVDIHKNGDAFRVANSGGYDIFRITQGATYPIYGVKRTSIYSSLVSANSFETMDSLNVKAYKAGGNHNGVKIKGVFVEYGTDYNPSGNLEYAIGVHSKFSSSRGAGVNITNLYGFYHEASNTNSLAITNQYGLYLADSGVATNKYGIYQVGSSFTNYFEGQLTIPATPVASTDAASKGYVDAQVGTADTLQEVTDLGNTTTNSITFAGGTSTGNFEVNKGSAAIAVVEAGGANLKMVAGGATGYVGTYNNTNLTFVTNSSEKMRLTSDGRLGINNTSPGTKLHVGTGSGASVDTGYQIVADSPGIAGIQILAANNQSSRVIFGDADDNDVGMIKYDHTDNSMGFRTNGSGNERMRITSGGNLLIGTTTDNGERLQVNGNARVVTGGNTFLNIHHGNVGFIAFKDNSISSPNEFKIQHNYSQNNDFRIARNTGGTDFVIDNSGNTSLGGSLTGTTATFNDVFFGTSTYKGKLSWDTGKVLIGTSTANTDIVFIRNFNTELARITSGGNLLIGTTSDDGSSKLQVNGDVKISSEKFLYLGSNANGFGSNSNSSPIIRSNNGNIFFDSNSSDNINIYLQPNGGQIGDTAKIHFNSRAVVGWFNSAVYLGDNGQNKDIKLQVNSSDIIGLTSNTERFRIKSGGNFLIATTTDDGSSKLQVDGNIKIGDNNNFIAGTGSDFQIQHTGSHSYVDNFTGDLYIRQNATDEDMFFMADDGSGNATTYFFLDGSATQTKFNKDTRHVDNIKVLVGSAGDAAWWHDGTRTRLDNYTGNLEITNYVDDSDIVFKSDNGSGGTTDYIRLDGSQTTVNVYKTLLIGTTTNTGAYKIDVAGKQRVQDTLELDDVLMLNAISTPSDPAAGKSVIYMDSSDGGIKCKINVGGTVVTRTIASFE